MRCSVPELVRELRFQVHCDTNKRTIDKQFYTVTQLVKFLIQLRDEEGLSVDDFGLEDLSDD